MIDPLSQQVTSNERRKLIVAVIACREIARNELSLADDGYRPTRSASYQQ